MYVSFSNCSVAEAETYPNMEQVTEKALGFQINEAPGQTVAGLTSLTY